MQETILITGGSGLVGTHLTTLLLSKGYEVRHISRSGSKGNIVPSFSWNLDDNAWQPEAIKGVDYIIHLAGANVAEGRWTKKRKQQILESRIRGSKLVTEMVEASNGAIKGVISASAVGFYGIRNPDNLVTESDHPGDDFLAKVCMQWEKSIEQSNTNLAILRTGVVLSKDGGAIPKMLTPIKLGIGSPLGAGYQPMPWIHINDLCNIYLFAIEKGLKGVFNAVAPEIVTNKELTHVMAKAVSRKILFPNVPAFVLRVMLGEMSSMLLIGVRVSANKITEAGFEFEYPTITKALKHILV